MKLRVNLAFLKQLYRGLSKILSLQIPLVVIVVVQSPSHVQLFATPWTAAHQASPYHYLPESAQIHVQ